MKPPKAARGRSMKVRPTQSRRGVKGQLPLAGSRDSVPCGVWGNAPTVPRPTNSKEAANKGAGSAASLPLTLRVRRRAPKLLFPPRFREEPIKTPYRVRKCPVWGFNCHDIISASPQILPATARQSSETCTSDAQHRGTPGHCPAAADPASLGRARSTSACAD